MKSILETLAIGATVVALATAAQAANNDAKVNVGTAAPVVAAPVCATSAAVAATGVHKGTADAKPACAAPAHAAAGNPTATAQSSH